MQYILESLVTSLATYLLDENAHVTHARLVSLHKVKSLTSGSNVSRACHKELAMDCLFQFHLAENFYQVLVNLERTVHL